MPGDVWLSKRKAEIAVEALGQVPILRIDERDVIQKETNQVILKFIQKFRDNLCNRAISSSRVECT